MGLERLLDFPRGDVLAAPPNRVLEAVDETEVPVVVADDPVAGVEPAV